MCITQVAPGITVGERIIAGSWGKDSIAALGFVLRRLSPCSPAAHWNSWESAEVSLTFDPVWKTSQHLVKTFHSSSVTPTSILGRSSFGPWFAVRDGFCLARP